MWAECDGTQTQQPGQHPSVGAHHQLCAAKACHIQKLFSKILTLCTHAAGKLKMHMITHAIGGGGVSLPWTGNDVFVGRDTESLQTRSSHEFFVFLHMGSQGGFPGAMKEGVTLSPLLLPSVPSVTCI